MKWINKFKLFLFDFDGLLVDTEMLHFTAYQEMCQKRGVKLKWDFHRFCEVAHSTSEGLKEGIYSEHRALQMQEPRWEVLYDEKKTIYLDLLDKGRLNWMPGAEKLLQYLNKEQINRCVVTNSPLEQIERIKKQLPGLQLVSKWITREDYERPKPSPDGYLKALELFKRQGDQVIGFEDSKKGLMALKYSGCDVNMLICNQNHPQLQAIPFEDYFHFNTLDAIPDAFLDR